MKKLISLLLAMVLLFSFALADDFVNVKVTNSKLLTQISDDESGWIEAEDLLVGAAAVIVYLDLISEGVDFQVDTDSWSPAVYVSSEEVSDTLYFAFHDKATDKYLWAWYGLKTKKLTYDKNEMKAAKTKTTSRNLNKNFREISSTQFTKSINYVYEIISGK